MRRIALAVLALAAVAAAAAPRPAAADLDVLLANGDALRGTLSDAAERETLRFACPAGARLSVDLRAKRSADGAALRVHDPSGAEIAAADGRSARVTKLVLETSGVHRAVVQSLGPVGAGDYDVRLRWTSPTRFSAAVDTAAADTASLVFAADARAVVNLRVGAARGSRAAPRLVDVTGPSGVVATFAGGTSARWSPVETATYTVRWTNSAAQDGAVAASVKVKPPRAERRRVAATFREIPEGTNVVAAAVIPKAGGRLEAPAGLLAGVSVEFRTGALKKPTLVALGVRPDMTPPRPARSTRATASVLVAPYNGKIRSNGVTVTLPHGTPPPRYPTVVRAFSQKPVTYLVEEVTGATVDADLRRVSFQPKRLTTFQGFHVLPTEQVPHQVVDLAGAATRVQLAGDVMLVAFDAATVQGLDEAGEVLVLERSGLSWSVAATLRAPAPTAGARFGGALAVRRGAGGESLLVAEPFGTNASDLADGAVHEYVRSGGAWVLRATVRSPVPATTDGFGYAISVDGDRLAVSTQYEAPTLRPRVFLYRRDSGGWASEGPAVAEFRDVRYAPQVALSGATLVIGVVDDRSGADPSVEQPGSVHLYESDGTTWTRTHQFSMPNPRRGDSFGRAVAATPGFAAASGYDGGDTTGQTFALRDAGYEWVVETPGRVPTPSGAHPQFGKTLSMAGQQLACSSHGGGVVWRFASNRWDVQWILQEGVTLEKGRTYNTQNLAFDGETAALLTTSWPTGTEDASARLALFDVPRE